MKKEHKILINLIQDYLENNPEQRFGQALFNLKINEFRENLHPPSQQFQLRDIYNDADSAIIVRIKSQLEWFELQKKVNQKVTKKSSFEGMTIRERLLQTELLEDFDKLKSIRPLHAKFILESLKVDVETIRKILNT